MKLHQPQANCFLKQAILLPSEVFQTQLENKKQGSEYVQTLSCLPFGPEQFFCTLASKQSYWLLSLAHLLPDFDALEEVQDAELLFLALLLTPMCPGAGPCLF